jgi:hypothetical protein
MRVEAIDGAPIAARYQGPVTSTVT